MKRVTEDELMRIFNENGGYSLNNKYHLAEINGALTLQERCGATIGAVKFYAVTDADRFNEYVRKTERMDNVERTLNLYAVEMVEHYLKEASK